MKIILFILLSYILFSLARFIFRSSSKKKRVVFTRTTKNSLIKEKDISSQAKIIDEKRLDDND